VNVNPRGKSPHKSCPVSSNPIKMGRPRGESNFGQGGASDGIWAISKGTAPVANTAAIQDPAQMQRAARVPDAQ